MTMFTQPLDAAHAMSQQALTRVIIDYAQATGWLVEYDRTMKMKVFSSGFSDLVLVRERILFVTLATATGVIRNEQHEWIRRLKKAGADTRIWRPEQWLDGTIDKALD